MQPLAREVESRTQRLAEASVRELYDDPFWFARYGEERARRFGGEDAVFHVLWLPRVAAGPGGGAGPGRRRGGPAPGDGGYRAHRLEKEQS